VSDPAAAVGALLTAGAELTQLVQELGRSRREHPTDDLTSALVNSRVDGDCLSDSDLGSFFVLLVVAGNETTRNAISHGMKALCDFPAERARWMADFETLARPVEEIVRWATPVMHFRRTATRDTELSGQRIREGEKVVLWYTSANRDEAVFADPYRFDVGRTPSEHVGFGAPGPHFCLGANLARREITVMFRELFRRLPDLRITGEPTAAVRVHQRHQAHAVRVHARRPISLNYLKTPSSASFSRSSSVRLNNSVWTQSLSWPSSGPARS